MYKFAKDILQSYALGFYFGPILVAVGLYMNFSAFDFSRNAYEIEATVANIEKKKSKNSYVYRATFAFDLSSSERVEFTGDTWVTPMPHAEGDKVTALFNPETQQIRSYALVRQQNGFANALELIGVLLFAVGYLVRCSQNRKPAEPI